MRLWVMENGLVDLTGHHFNNSIGLARECARRGIEAHFLVHRDARPEVIELLRARPVFGYRPYDQVSRDPLAGPLESLFFQGRAFAAGFAAGAAAGLGREDVVFVPTTMQNEVYGCAAGINALAPDRRPRLVLNFMVENFLVPGTFELGPEAGLYRFAIRELERVLHPDRRLLTTSGTRMAEWLAKVLDRPVATYPMPKHYPDDIVDDTALPVPASGPCTVAVLGHSLLAKGFQRVPRLVAATPGLRWLVQLATAPGQDGMWEEIRQALDAAPNVELVAGSLAPDAYYALLARADIVLLPYDPAFLPLRSSGVFSEAVAAGKVVVVAHDTWMADHLAAGHGAGTTFAGKDPDDIFHALTQALARLPELRAHARSAAPGWRREQSISAYFDRLLPALAAAETGRSPLQPV